MKKFLLIAVASMFALVATAQHTVPRFGTLKNEGNTGASLNYKLITVTTTSATTVAYEAPSAFESVIQVSTLKHALLDSMSVKNAYLGDRVTFLFTCDTLTGGRVVTFGNNIKSTGTLTVPASKKATARFMFDGVSWLEISRALMAN